MDGSAALVLMFSALAVILVGVASQQRVCYSGPPPVPDPDHPEDWKKQVMQEIRKNCPGRRQPTPAGTGKPAPASTEEPTPAGTEEPASAVVQENKITLYGYNGANGVDTSPLTEEDLTSPTRFWVTYDRDEIKVGRDGTDQPLVRLDAPDPPKEIRHLEFHSNRNADWEIYMPCDLVEN